MRGDLPSFVRIEAVADEAVYITQNNDHEKCSDEADCYSCSYGQYGCYIHLQAFDYVYRLAQCCQLAKDYFNNTRFGF